MRRQTILPFEIEQTDAPLMAWGGMILPYEMIDQSVLRTPRSGRGYKSLTLLRRVMPLILILHGRTWRRQEAR